MSEQTKPKNKSIKQSNDDYLNFSATPADDENEATISFDRVSHPT